MSTTNVEDMEQAKQDIMGRCLLAVAEAFAMAESTTIVLVAGGFQFTITVDEVNNE